VGSVRLQGELFGGHAGEAVLDLQPVRVQCGRLLDHRRERRGDVGGELVVEQVESVPSPTAACASSGATTSSQCADHRQRPADTQRHPLMVDM
jgi:hypothetical protein